MFDAANRLRGDRCAQDDREIANRGVSQYVLTNLRLRPDRSAEVLRDLERQHRNLRAWDGYGLSSARIDADSDMRLGAVVTHARSRMQLDKRVFTAAPDLSMPSGDADDSGLDGDAGLDTRGSRCYKAQVSEADFDRFDPGYSMPSVDHIIPPWTLGGAMSRDIARSGRFKRLLRTGGDMGRWMRTASGMPHQGNLAGVGQLDART